jgi:hypothetical protein
MSQSLIVWSVLPDAKMPSLGLKAMEFTDPVWPASVRSSRPLATSQSLIVLSKLPEAKVLPSGLKATELTQSG